MSAGRDAGRHKLEGHRALLLAQLECEPEDADSHYQLGLCDLGRGQPEEAVRSFLEALRDQPHWPRTWLFIARLTQGTPVDGLVKHLRTALPDGELSRVLSLISNLPPIYDEGRRILLD